ncbi:MAG: 4-alpha-glucanotransferase [Thermodesulfovibrio sp.]|nr:4-alpha-glucanotransferase [Thermodesulfovibrio sp.]
MKNLNQLIDKVSELVGIIPYYYNYKGQRIEISYETKIKIISAMGINPEQESLIYWIDYFENKSWKSFLEPVYVIKQGGSIEIYARENLKNCHIELSPLKDLGNQCESLILSIAFDTLIQEQKRVFDDGIYFKYIIPVPLIPIGYYIISIFLEKSIHKSILIVVPDSCFTPFKNKTWGLHLNLWSLRGDKKEGDFSLLKEFARSINSLGGFISINPLHMNEPEDFYGISPYSAISRQFNTPLYISKTAVEEKNEEFFDYANVWKEKIEALKREFDKFYKAYINEEDNSKRFIDYKNKLCPAMREDLKYFAVFCFLREKYGKNWQNWEEKFKKPNREFLSKIYSKNNKDVIFYEYLQWLIHEELEEISKYPVLLDLGFGSTKSSFDAWINQEIYAFSAEYGAPPDDFNPNGQKWGFPAIIPFKLRENAYIPFVKILRSNMRTKLLRIDHALGLFRAFWIPESATPCEGAYVKYPWKDLLGIICLESNINNTGVIGEDLGTAEEWMKEELIKRKICSWKVFYFEKNSYGYKPGNIYPEDALCSITTHDLPTLKGFWYGRDIELRKAFSIFNQNQFERALLERKEDKEKIIALLKQEGLLEGEVLVEKILTGIIKFLANTKAKYLLLYAEDILLLEEQTNLPGTITEYPNWRRKLPLSYEQILKTPIFEEIKTILSEAGRILPSH